MEIPSINDIVSGNSSRKNINVYDNVSDRVRSVDCLYVVKLPHYQHHSPASSVYNRKAKPPPPQTPPPSLKSPPHYNKI